MKGITIILTLIMTFSIQAQETRTPNGIYDERHNSYALTHGTIYKDHATRLEDATLVFRDGLIVSIKAGGEVPAGFVEIDLGGRFVYPGLIDLNTSYGLPEPAKTPALAYSSKEILATTNHGAYNANESIKSHYNAVDHFKVDKKAGETLRKLGFSTVLSLSADGIARGTSSLVTLGNELANDAVLEDKAAAHYSFTKGSSKQFYPISRMGSVALLRQTHLDAEWYGNLDKPPFRDLSLEGWNNSQSLPQIFESTNWKTAILADSVGDEHSVQYIINGSGDEYQRLNLLKATDASFIIPVNFPAAYEVDDPIDTERITLSEMKHWELAPYNPARLTEADIEFAITSKESGKDFWENLRKAVNNGLSKPRAIAALTTVPATLLGKADQIGSLAPGRLANFIITSGDIFEKKSKINENWIRGKKYVINEFAPDFTGNYRLTVADQQFHLKITGETGKYKVKLKDEAEDAPGEVEEDKQSNDKQPNKKPGSKVSISKDLISLSLVPGPEKQAIRFSGWPIEGGWSGTGEMANGDTANFRLIFIEPLDSKAETSKKKAENLADKSEPGAIIYPFVAYGRQSQPQRQNTLIKNTTVWTSEDEGILEHTDVLIRNGKINKVGQNLSAKNAIVIDGTGQHLTAGIIDEHSHIALDGVNEIATNSSMVRMADVVDSEDIAIYRDLAGGVTAAQLLHGSANPIGGQSALIKMRWGLSPRQMLIEDADKFIKFALGENVKRSRNTSSIRYPQTRMGVEQFYMDAFGQARKYEKDHHEFKRMSRSARRKTVAPRRNLVYDTMLEILNGERFITSHSYVQSEINMLMKVAEHHGFHINTFTHILEGYKVADKMAQHGVGASTFADWWAYKWEVRYAIPYNVALLHQAGVVTAINSDSAEMSRRLNQEAAKSIKYGNLSEEEAIKLITINPAKLLHLDDRMGSIKATKDADLVLWTDNPLSVYARVNKTFIDGIVYYDAEEDVAVRQDIKVERARLIQKLRLAPRRKDRDKPPKVKPTKMQYWHTSGLGQ